ncbi:IclR family transcriptional regulator [Peptoniphilus catoniae]|uniref:IclR family transcriptional regulator n=1 Tax=Peptoniphilus catoniae TaxID=1660341 RepID=UPI0010FD7CAF|nr:IclR family transcriptional regulator [Peptoniphilus catoniae]
MIQSLKKASSILEFMKIENREYSISEISDALDIPSSTTHRILNTLINCDFVSKDNKSHLYKLGPGLISLGVAASANISLQSDSLPILNDLSKITKEDSFIIIRSGNNGLVVGKALGEHSIKVVENFGREIPLHMGAIRKVILANQSDSFIEEYMKLDLEPYLNKNSLDKDQLRRELEEIKEQKYAISYSEYILNTSGIGSAVFNYKNEFVASLGIVVPLYRLKGKEKELINSVMEAAEKLSYKLGYYKL